MAKKEHLLTAKATLIRALELTEKALDGFPIPGAKGAIGAVIEIIREVEVCTKIQLPLYHPYRHCREWPPMQNSVTNWERIS